MLKISLIFKKNTNSTGIIIIIIIITLFKVDKNANVIQVTSNKIAAISITR